MAETASSIAILGAGLTGMSAALRLAELGVGYRIFEKARRVGGHAITREEAGYRFDCTGHLLHMRNPRMRERVLELIGSELVQVQRKSLVYSHGVYTRYPFQANTYGLPASVAFECVRDFVKAHFAADKPIPENFEQFCEIHFGAGISRHFMVPYNERLWGVPLSEITSAWCDRFVPLPKLDDVLAGALGLNDRELGYNAHPLYPRRGIGTLSEALGRKLQHVEFEQAPLRIDRKRRTLIFEQRELPFQVLLSTIPLPRLIALLSPEPPRAVLEATARLRYTALNYLDVALRVPMAKEFHWVYVPERRFPFYRVGSYSQISPAMAPPGTASLYVELAERGTLALSDVLPGVTAGLLEMGVIRGPGDIAFARLRCLDPAYVIYDHAYAGALEHIRAFLENERIVSSGRYGDWNYSSMEDALLFGESAAEKAASWL